MGWVIQQVWDDQRSLSVLQRSLRQLSMNFLRQLCFSRSRPAVQHSSTTLSLSSSHMFHPPRQAHRGWARLLHLPHAQVQTVESQREQRSLCRSLATKFEDLNSRAPFSTFQRPLMSMQKMWMDTPSRICRVGRESRPLLWQSWHSMALTLLGGTFLREQGSQTPSIGEQQYLWNLTWHSEQQRKGLYCSWQGLRHPAQAVFSTPFVFFLVFLLFFRFMYSSNSFLSVILRDSPSMAPYCYRVSRLAKQLRQSISGLLRAILRFFLMRQAMYLSSTDSTGETYCLGQTTTLSQILLTSWFIRTLFCFMRNRRKATSTAVSERYSLDPLLLLYSCCLSVRRVMKDWRLLMRQASSRETSIILERSCPQNTAKQCLSWLQTRTREWECICRVRMRSTYLKSSSKGAL